MPQVNIFRWRPGLGWLVFSGGGAVTSEDVQSIEASVLSHTHSQGPLAYIWAAGDIEAADYHMDALREMGARTGYLVDILTEAEDTLQRQLAEAGVIILGDGPRVPMLYDALGGVVEQTLESAYERGATIYAVGQSAALLGSYVWTGQQLVPGRGWLQHALIWPGYAAEEHADELRTRLLQMPAGYGLGLGTGAALALGPRGDVEVWGSTAITVSLGYGPQEEE